MKQQSLFSSDQNDVPTWSLFIDGAARNNPGLAGAGVYIKQNGEVAYEHGFYLGIKTNNQAEYLALLIGLIILQDFVQPGESVRVISDSQLLVRQLNGAYRVKNPKLQSLSLLARNLLENFQAKVEHVLREENVHADKMANRGIDWQTPVPDVVLSILERHDIHV